MRARDLDAEEGGVVLAALLAYADYDSRARRLFDRVAEAPLIILCERD